jgi:hypothetical protein
MTVALIVLAILVIITHGQILFVLAPIALGFLVIGMIF